MLIFRHVIGEWIWERKNYNFLLMLIISSTQHTVVIFSLVVCFGSEKF